MAHVELSPEGIIMFDDKSLHGMFHGAYRDTQGFFCNGASKHARDVSCAR